MSKRSLEKLCIWQGKAAILPGIGIFYGKSGDNCEHKHWAHQLSIGLKGEIEVARGASLITDTALFIPADSPHRLSPGKILSLYLDPNTVIAKTLAETIDINSGIVTVPIELTRLVHRCFTGELSLEAGVLLFQQMLGTPESSGQNERLAIVMEKLQNILTLGTDVDRLELAKLTNLSPSRFSHWFKEETGMPLRRYRKWLHLMRSISVALKGESLSAAAHDAQFADQAHFTRTFKEAFGVTPSLALSALRMMK